MDSGIARIWCQEGHKVLVFISFVVIRPNSTIQQLLIVYKEATVNIQSLSNFVQVKVN